VCSSCGAPPCVVVSAHLTEAQPPLARFCISCGKRLLAAGTPSPHPRAGWSGVAESTETQLFTQSNYIAGEVAVPLSVVFAVARVVATRCRNEGALPENDVARVQAPALPAIPGPLPSFSAAVQRSAVTPPSLHTSDFLDTVQLRGGCVPRDVGTVAAAPVLSPISPDDGAQCRLIPLRCTTSRHTNLRRSGSNRSGYSRSPSPSIVIPPGDINDTVVADAPGALALLPPSPLPPRCSHTLPRHSCSYDSDVNVPASTTACGHPAGGPRSCSVFEEDGVVRRRSAASLAPPLLQLPPPPRRVALDAEERAHGAAQQQAYERLRDALLQQL
jgi:hypothetical protein